MKVSLVQIYNSLNNQPEKKREFAQRMKSEFDIYETNFRDSGLFSFLDYIDQNRELRKKANRIMDELGISYVPSLQKLAYDKLPDNLKRQYKNYMDREYTRRMGGKRKSKHLQKGRGLEQKRKEMLDRRLNELRNKYPHLSETELSSILLKEIETNRALQDYYVKNEDAYQTTVQYDEAKRSGTLYKAPSPSRLRKVYSKIKRSLSRR